MVSNVFALSTHQLDFSTRCSRTTRLESSLKRLEMPIYDRIKANTLYLNIKMFCETSYYPFGVASFANTQMNNQWIVLTSIVCFLYSPLFSFFLCSKVYIYIVGIQISTPIWVKPVIIVRSPFYFRL